MRSSSWTLTLIDHELARPGEIAEIPDPDQSPLLIRLQKWHATALSDNAPQLVLNNRGHSHPLRSKTHRRPFLCSMQSQPQAVMHSLHLQPHMEEVSTSAMSIGCWIQGSSTHESAGRTDC